MSASISFESSFALVRTRSSFSIAGSISSTHQAAFVSTVFSIVGLVAHCKVMSQSNSPGELQLNFNYHTELIDIVHRFDIY